MMDRVEGKLNQVSFYPGNIGILVLHISRYSDGPRLFMVITNEPESEITVDGALVRPHELMMFLESANANVVLYPLKERYGAALKAEFTRVDSGTT